MRVFFAIPTPYLQPVDCDTLYADPVTSNIDATSFHQIELCPQIKTLLGDWLFFLRCTSSLSAFAGKGLTDQIAL